MKIKKEFIGAKVFCSTLRQFFLIEEGNEKKYSRLGLDIFEKRKQPKLVKNVKNTKKRNNSGGGNGNGTNNDNKS